MEAAWPFVEINIHDGDNTSHDIYVLRVIVLCRDCQLSFTMPINHSPALVEISATHSCSNLRHPRQFACN